MNTLIILLLILIVTNNNFKTRLGLVIFLVIISYLENIRNNYYKEDFTESNIDFVNNMILKNKELKSGINECMTDKEYKFFLNKIKCLSNNSRVKSTINNKINNVLPSKLSIAQYLLKSLTF